MRRPTLFEWVFYVYGYVPQKDKSTAFIFFVPWIQANKIVDKEKN